MVWCGITSACLIGPYFLEDNVTGVSYLAMLDEYLWPAVRYKRLIFQHDGAPAHYERNVRNWLDHKFKNLWIGRRGPTEWPPRSPDLTPCDFFLWGYLKDLVYRQRPSTIAQLRATIERCCQEIPLEMFGRTCHSHNTCTKMTLESSRYSYDISILYNFLCPEIFIGKN